MRNEYTVTRSVEGCMMKTGIRLVSSLLVISLGMGCTTAYDQYGRPRQVIEPGAAFVGAAAIGLLAYGLASSNRSNDCAPQYRSQRYYGSQGYYRPQGYRQGYRNPHFYAPQHCRY